MLGTTRKNSPNESVLFWRAGDSRPLSSVLLHRKRSPGAHVPGSPLAFVLGIFMSLPFLLLLPIPISAQEYDDKSASEWVPLLTHDNPNMRQTAAYALGAMRTRDKDAITALAERLQDNEARIRAEAADSLGRIGYSARAALDPLIDVLQTDKTDSVRAAAALAIGYVGGSEEAANVLAIALTKDSCALVRCHAASALARMGRSAKAAVPALVSALKDSHLDVQRNARNALKRLDPSKLE